jgi:hypothetical protein
MARDLSPSGCMILATWEEGSVGGSVERRHFALMSCWSGTGGYVWDLDAKKWDLWKVMQSCPRRRLLTGGRRNGHFLGGLAWESGRPQCNHARALLP